MQKYALVSMGGTIVSRIDPATGLAMPGQSGKTNTAQLRQLFKT